MSKSAANPSPQKPRKKCKHRYIVGLYDRAAMIDLAKDGLDYMALSIPEDILAFGSCEEYAEWLEWFKYDQGPDPKWIIEAAKEKV